MHSPIRTRLHALPVALFALALAAAPALAAEEVFTIDPVHTSVQFRIRHFVSRVTGSFNTYSGEVHLDRANLAKGSVAFELDAASIDTRNEKRDGHLRGPDFFDVEKNPKITFKSTKVTVDEKNPNNLSVAGDLTMHGVTKPITLVAVLEGFLTDPWKNERVGFTVSGTIDRKDFGIVWNQTLDQGGTMLGDDVEVMIGIEAVKKAAAAPETKKTEETKKG